MTKVHNKLETLANEENIKMVSRETIKNNGIRPSMNGDPLRQYFASRNTVIPLIPYQLNKNPVPIKLYCYHGGKKLTQILTNINNYGALDNINEIIENAIKFVWKARKKEIPFNPYEQLALIVHYDPNNFLIFKGELAVIDNPHWYKEDMTQEEICQIQKEYFLNGFDNNLRRGYRQIL